MAQVAGYSFNPETVSGSSVRDLSGYFTHGTIVGSAAIVPGKTGYGDALNCTGGALTATALDDTYPLTVDSGITLAAWVKLNDATAAARCIASVANETALKAALYASNASGNVEAKVQGVTYSTTTSIRDGNWHHVILSFDMLTSPDRLRIIVDGAAVLDTTSTTALSYSDGTDATLNVGRNSFTGTEALNGVVDDFRWWVDGIDSTFWATMMGAEQIDNQLAIYSFDAGTTEDGGIYNRDLTITSAGSYGTGLYGRSLQSDGTGHGAFGTVNFPDSDRVNITGYVRLDVAPASATPVMAIDTTGGSSRMRLVVNTDRTLTMTWVTVYGTYSVTSGSVLTVGQWSRFQLNMNPTYVGIRLNSTSQTQTATTQPLPVMTPTADNMNVLYVGGDATAGGQISFDYLTFTKNFINDPTDTYWCGPPLLEPQKPGNTARGYYDFNEGTGTTVGDQGPLGNTLTLTASGSWVTGEEGTALNNNGSSPGASSSTLNWGTTPAGWGISVWFNFHATGTETRIISLLTSAGDPVAHVGWEDTKPWWRLYGSGGTTDQVIFPESAGTITAGTWAHLAASCNGNTFVVFLNGKKIGSVPWNYGSMLTPAWIRVGTDNRGFTSNVDIDDLLLLGDPLSESGVQWLFENPGAFASGAPVSRSLSTEWSVGGKVEQSRSTTWNTRQQVSQTRSTTWDVAGALVAVSRALSTTWDVASALASVSVSRATSWAVKAFANKNLSTSWNVESDEVAPEVPTKRVVFPTYQIPLGRSRLLRRYLVPVPSSLVKVNGEWGVVTAPAQDLLEAADAYFVGGYTYLLTESEVADLGLPPQYVENIS